MLYAIGKWFFRIFFSTIYRVRSSGQHHIPEQGAVILCCNHISLWDPPVLGTFANRKVHFMAKSELFQLNLLNKLFTSLGAFPVKRGGVSKESIRTALALLETDAMIGIFPEGTRSNAGGTGQKGAANLALKSQATVIPVAIVGPYRIFRTMEIIYGSPVDVSEFQNTSDDLEKATEKIMISIRSMHEWNRNQYTKKMNEK
jgi:1-acyl-sn-glycerol-3-phosphate acyltransferase